MAVLIDYIQKHYPYLSVYNILTTLLSSILLAIVIRWLLGRRRLYLLSWGLPGPLALPFFGSAFPAAEALQSFLDESKKYSSPYRVWLGTTLVVVCTDPEDIKNVLFENYIPHKPQLYYYWSQGLGDGLLTAYGGTKWRSHRALLNPAFGAASVGSHQLVIQKHCLKMLDVVLALSGGGEVDVFVHCARLCSDIVADSLLKDEYTNFQSGELDYLLQAMDEISSIVYKRTTTPWLHPDFIFNKTEHYRKLLGARQDIEDYATRVYERAKLRFFQRNEFARHPDSKEVKTPIDVLLEARFGAANLSEVEVIEEIMNIYSAGVDKTSTILSFFILMMGMHRACQDRLYGEIRDHFKGDLSAGVSPEDLGKLPYLDMCTGEVLRMFPARPFTFRKATKDVRLENRNLTIPKDTTLLISPYLTHMSSGLWEQPEKFDPERFSAGSRAERHPCAFGPFSAGPRSCIGQQLGSQVVKTTIVYLLNRFQFHSSTKMEELSLSNDMNIRLLRGHRVEVQERLRDRVL